MNSTRSTVADQSKLGILPFGVSALEPLRVVDARPQLVHFCVMDFAIGPSDTNVWLLKKFFKVDGTRWSAAPMPHGVLLIFFFIVSSLHPRFHETLLTMYPIMANNNTEKQKRQHHFSGP